MIIQNKENIMIMEDKKRKEKPMGFFIKVTKEEEEIIKQLRKKYAINISQFLRNSLLEYHKKLGEIK